MTFLPLAAYLLFFGSPWPEQPPAQFNHPYHGYLTVKSGTEAQIHQWCGFNARACARPHGSHCTIYVPAPTPTASPDVLAAIRRHEIGHCNGWRHAR